MLSINLKNIAIPFGVMFLLSSLLILLGGPLTYGQYFLLGSTNINSFYFKIIMLFSASISILLKKHLIPKSIFMSWTILMICIIITIIYNVIFLYRDLSQIFIGVNSYLSLALLTPLAFLFGGGRYIKRFLNIVVFITIPLALFGIFQYINNQTYLPEIKINDRSFINSIWFFDRIRAVSLFNSGLDFGTFLIFSFGVVISNSSSFRGILKLLVVLIITVAIYMTLTRNTYIGLIMAFITFFVTFLPNQFRFKIIKIIPIVFILISLLILFLPQGADSGVANANSLDARLDIWKESFQRLNLLGLPGILFGSGEVQSYTLENTSATIIDNYPLAIIFFGGIFCLISFYFYIASLWIYVVKSINGSRISKAVLISVSASFGMQMFNIVAVMPFICFILLFLHQGEEDENNSHP